MAHSGKCLCGEVSYELEGEPLAVAVCHCANCQRQGGSAFSVNVIMMEDQISISGPIKTFEDRGESGDAVYVHRRFCGSCGSPIVSVPLGGGGIIAVKAGTLDDHSWVDPQVEAWCVHKQSWVDLPGLTSMERE
jgi:hypothetical protein